MNSNHLGCAWRLINYWLPVVLMLSLMFYLSSDRFSVEHTQGMVERILAGFLPAASADTLAYINHLLRKLAHFFGYGLLGGLLFRAFRGGNTVPWRMAWVVYSSLVVIAWAALDELRQTFSPVRHGSFSDVLLDTAGGLFMLLLISLYYRKQRE